MSILAFCTSSSFSFILHSFPSFFTPLSSILQIFIFCFDCSSDTDTTLNNVTVLYLKSEKSSFMSFWIGANVINSLFFGKISNLKSPHHNIWLLSFDLENLFINQCLFAWIVRMMRHHFSPSSFPDFIQNFDLKRFSASLHWGFLRLEQFLCWLFYQDHFIFYLRDRTSSHTSRFQGRNF